MREEIKYIADDGEVFETKEECEQYEKSLEEPPVDFWMKNNRGDFINKYSWAEEIFLGSQAAAEWFVAKYPESQYYYPWGGRAKDAIPGHWVKDPFGDWEKATSINSLCPKCGRSDFDILDIDDQDKISYLTANVKCTHCGNQYLIQYYPITASALG